MLNNVNLIGRLTKDPELKYTQNGKAVTTFTLAVNRSYTNAQGEREADFIPIVAWGKIAENCATYLGKGSLVAVEGRIQVRTYEAKDGGRRWVTEIVSAAVYFLDSKNGNAGNANDNAEKNQITGFGDLVDFDPEDVPF